MSSQDYIIAIDFGTQSVRGMIFDRDGKVIGKEKIEYNPYFSIKPGYAEQDPDIYWDNMCKALKKLKSAHKTEWNKARAAVFTTIRATPVQVDKDGEVLRSIITWLDQRRVEGDTPFNVLEKGMFKLVGMSQTLDLIYRNAKSNWVKANEPEIWRKTYKYLLISGYLHYRMTGNFVDSTACQVGHIPFDYKNQTWSKSDFDFSWKLFGIERGMLPDLVEAGEVIGKVTAKAASETGLPSGLPIIAGGTDKGCETLGVGCINEKSASISFGTTATIQTTSNKYFNTIPFFPPYPAIMKGTYNPEIEVFRGYWMISWFKKEFAMHELEEAKKLKVSPEELLNKRLKDIPPGCQGLLLYPSWSPEITTPVDKGAIIGFGDVHTRTHIYRAIIEGINYALMDGLHKIEKKTKKKVEFIALSGGGSQSDEISQITADMFNRPVKRIHTFETSALGAAMIGFVGSGVYGSYEEAIDNMVHYKSVLNPRKENVQIYKDLYNKVYKKIHGTLEPLNREIQKITNYPEL